MPDSEVWILFPGDDELPSLLPLEDLLHWPHSKVTVRNSQCLSHRGQEYRIYRKGCFTPKERPETLLKALLRFLDIPVMSWPFSPDVEPKASFYFKLQCSNIIR